MNNALEKMGFTPSDYHQIISQVFSGQEHHFENLINSFFNRAQLMTDNFNSFSEQNDLEENTDLWNALYELFNNIRSFKKAGKFGVFKEREAAFGLPSNVLTENDINDKGDIDNLPEIIVIYRGMSKEEFKSGDFGQSWTTDYETARRFAEETYSDKPKGIVAKTTISKREILHYDKNKEFEVIVIKGSPKNPMY